MSISGITSGMGNAAMSFQAIGGQMGNGGIAVASASGASGSDGQLMAALSKSVRDEVAFMIIDSFLEAKGAQLSKNAGGASIGAAMNIYSVSQGPDCMKFINKISQAALALSTLQAIA